MDISFPSAKGRTMDTMKAGLPATAQEAQPLTLCAPCLDEIEAEPIRMLWDGVLPLGKLVLVDGDPDVGKSFMSLDLARRVMLGLEWPDGKPGGEPAGVILVGAEDDLRDTVLPRLEVMGADCSRIRAFQGFTRNQRLVRAPSFPGDDDALRRLIVETKARLVIIDPLMQFVDPAYATINDQAVRQALFPLVEMARETQCTLIAIRHLTKMAGGIKALYRGSGSLASSA
jgi:RecA-family ATPase